MPSNECVLILDGSGHLFLPFLFCTVPKRSQTFSCQGLICFLLYTLAVTLTHMVNCVPVYDDIHWHKLLECWHTFLISTLIEPIISHIDNRLPYSIMIPHNCQRCKISGDLLYMMCSSRCWITEMAPTVFVEKI